MCIDVAQTGNETVRTPAIDKLANDGIKLTQWISASPICTPSRTALMTGRYPARAGMESSTGNYRTLNSASHPGGLPSEEKTIPELVGVLLSFLDLVSGIVPLMPAPE